MLLNKLALALFCSINANTQCDVLDVNHQLDFVDQDQKYIVSICNKSWGRKNGTTKTMIDDKDEIEIQFHCPYKNLDYLRNKAPKGTFY